MSTDFLSSGVAEQAAYDASVGLKERTTRNGGQIVTALKMAWWILFLPALVPYWMLRKVYGALVCILNRFVRCCLVFKEAAVDGTALLREVVNRRVKALFACFLVGACITYGFIGLVYWVVGIAAYAMCFIPTDVRFFIQLKKDLHRAWDVALESEELEKTDQPQPVKIKNTFACRLAVRAISKVGLLAPTKANALVYQKVILDDMRELNVRCADRVRVLPLAIAACLHRPEEVMRVEGCIKQLFANTTGL